MDYYERQRAQHAAQANFGYRVLEQLHDVGFPLTDLAADPPLLVDDIAILHTDPICGEGASTPFDIVEVSARGDLGGARTCRLCADTHPLTVAVCGPAAQLAEAVGFASWAQSSLAPNRGRARRLDHAAIEILRATDRAEAARRDLALIPADRHTPVDIATLAALDVLDERLAAYRHDLTMRWRTRPRSTQDIWVRVASPAALAKLWIVEHDKPATMLRRGVATWPTVTCDPDRRWLVMRAPSTVVDAPWFDNVVARNLIEVLGPVQEFTEQDWFVFTELVNAAGADPQFAIAAAPAVLA